MGGLLIEAAGLRLYFAGDTAFHDRLFDQVRQAFGAVDIALVPIRAYAPANPMAHGHTTPEEIVQRVRALGAKTLVGMHWGTIVLSTEPPFEPPLRFRAAGRAQGYADEDLWLPAIGETRPLLRR